MVTVAVVGGGVSGLMAAYRLRTLLGTTARILVFESASRLGGKLRTVELGGALADIGAEAFLVTRPEVTDLVVELGIGGRLAHPTGARATVRAGGRTRRLPARTVMGIPADPELVSELCSARGAATVRAERHLGAVRLDEEDVNLGALLRARFGDELVDRLVDPLLSGVYAGGADGLGVRAVLPALAAALTTGANSVTDAAASLLPSGADTRPVFGTLRGGLAVLIDRLVVASAADVMLGETVRELRQGGAGWTVVTGSGDAVDVDGVVLAVPPPSARRLLADVDTAAAGAFAGIDVASMAVVGMAFPADTRLPDASGILIGSGERRADGTPLSAKAFTFSSRKWAHYAEQGVIVRGSVGRFGDPDALRATDDELIRQVRADLADLCGITDRPDAAMVQRWGGGLPQYAVGHIERVRRIEAAAERLDRFEIAGAALYGVGIPACVGTADAAARRLADRLLDSR